MSKPNLNRGELSTYNLHGGSNQARVRDHNERLVLSLVRRNQSLSRADIARLSGLSAQTVTVIMRALEKDELLLRGDPIRGKVGQPSIPMRLNPEGAYSIGLKVGRRSADLVLMDFVGNVRGRKRIAYHFPVTTDVMNFVTSGSEELLNMLPPATKHRMAGIGIAIPFELWNWGKHVGAPQHEMDAWRDFDLIAKVQDATGFPAFLQNDATAACGAELALGRGCEFENYCYLFVGFFIGGGLVLNNTVFTGPTNNAGAFGTMPIADDEPNYVPLLDRASIFVLENMLREKGVDPSVLWTQPNQWGDLGETLDIWIDKVGQSLARAIVATCAVVDFEAILIDGGFSADIREKIVAKTREKLDQLEITGVHRPTIYAGSVGPNAPAMGGAILPILSRYFISQTAIYH